MMLKLIKGDVALKINQAKYFFMDKYSELLLMC